MKRMVTDFINERNGKYAQLIRILLTTEQIHTELGEVLSV